MTKHTISQQPLRQFTVAQLGARGHYAVPRVLSEASKLDRFYTDICATKGFPKYFNAISKQFQNRPLARLAGRIPHGVDPSLITTFSRFGLEYAYRLSQAKSASETTQTFLWAGKTFNRLVLHQGLHGDGLYVFNTAGLELLQAAKAAGLKTLMEQTMAPRAIERQLFCEEQACYPNWEEPIAQDDHLAEYIEREQQEWALADTIFCGSEFVRQGIQQCQGSVERCVVIPYGVDTVASLPPKMLHSKPLRVLTVGTVGLRKGIPYVLAAAKRMKGAANFRVIGPVQLKPEAVAELQEFVELVGQVPRAQIMEHYAWADVFLLPSICEGSAIATYEALAYGLPVITTPNTGSIVEDGINGFVVPVRNVDAIVEHLEKLLYQRELLQKMSHAAVQRSVVGSLRQYGDRLLQAIQ